MESYLRSSGVNLRVFLAFCLSILTSLVFAGDRELVEPRGRVVLNCDVGSFSHMGGKVEIQAQAAFEKGSEVSSIVRVVVSGDPIEENTWIVSPEELEPLIEFFSAQLESDRATGVEENFGVLTGVVGVSGSQVFFGLGGPENRLGKGSLVAIDEDNAYLMIRLFRRAVGNVDWLRDRDPFRL